MIHLAAESHVDRSIDEAAAFVHTNVVGTFTMLEGAKRYWQRLGAADRATFRFLHVSTDEVFGSLGPAGRFSEHTPYDPRSPYSATKASGDHLARAWHHTYGLPVLVTNCSNNYGPFQLPEKLIPLMILRGVEGKSLPVYGDGGNVRDWLHVDDHVRALLAVVDRGTVGQTYTIGGDGERTNLEVVHGICAALDELSPAGAPHASRIEFVKDRPGHDRRYAMDATRIRRELGWAPRESFDAGLSDTVRWYLEHRDWCRRVTAAGYGLERLGLAHAREALS